MDASDCGKRNLAIVSTAVLATCVYQGIQSWQATKAAVTEEKDEEERKNKDLQARVSELQEQVRLAEESIAKLKRMRQEERTGRTAAEKALRTLAHEQLEERGYHFEPIGKVASCFADRRGTPRQGVLVPSARATIVLNKNIPPSSLEGIEEYSHLWVIFIFHENTNTVKMLNSSSNKTMPAKIAPPRLKGKKVGLFSTRTPHRPNSIGLTLVQVLRVHKNSIEIGGHDLVTGTPVLDIKPYVPYDSIPDFRCPQWVRDSDEIQHRQVLISDKAQAEVRSLIQQQVFQFYHSYDEVITAIKEILVLDIRAVHQGRGQASETIYHCHLDVADIAFITEESSIRVLSCTLFDANANH